MFGLIFIFEHAPLIPHKAFKSHNLFSFHCLSQISSALETLTCYFLINYLLDLFSSLKQAISLFEWLHCQNYRKLVFLI